MKIWVWENMSIRLDTTRFIFSIPLDWCLYIQIEINPTKIDISFAEQVPAAIYLVVCWIFLLPDSQTRQKSSFVQNGAPNISLVSF